MTVFVVSFFSKDTPEVVREIAHMTGGIVSIRTALPVHAHERSTADDYDTMVAFSFPAARTYMLPGIGVYIDDGYTTLRFTDMYMIFRKDLSDNPWNLMRTLLPLPDDVFNGYIANTGVLRRAVLFVDTTQKPAVFDGDDVK